MIVSVELLAFPLSPKYRKAANSPEKLFQQLRSTAKAAGIKIVATKRFVGGADWLMLYGPGGLDRVEPMRKQLADGGRVVCWDAAYWQRSKKLRVSIDHAHPQAYVMRREWPEDRIAKDRVTVYDHYDPAGPVVVASIGTKARAQYGDVVASWEQETVDWCRRFWPDRRIWYRPKPHHPATPPIGASLLASKSSIDAVIAGASLVATWHSNVAIDALRHGIPVVCMDGAAAAVSPSVVTYDQKPLDVETRRRFLANLAWFQWAPSEAAECWKFLRKLLL